MAEKNETSLPERWLQIIAIVAFFVFLLIDKIMGIVKPPIPEYWYGAAVGIAIFGSKAGKIIDVIRGKS